MAHAHLFNTDGEDIAICCNNCASQNLKRRNGTYMGRAIFSEVQHCDNCHAEVLDKGFVAWLTKAMTRNRLPK